MLQKLEYGNYSAAVTARWYTEHYSPQLFAVLKNLRPSLPMRLWYQHIVKTLAHRVQLLDHAPYSPDWMGRDFTPMKELIAVWDSVCVYI